MEKTTSQIQITGHDSYVYQHTHSKLLYNGFGLIRIK